MDQTNVIFILNLVDEGILKLQVARSSYVGLLKEAYGIVETYFADYRLGIPSDRKFYTDDGYVNICRLEIDGEGMDRLINYNFYGDEDLKEFLDAEIIKAKN